MNEWQGVAFILTWKWDASHLIKIWVVNPGLNTLTADESSCMTIKGWYSSWPHWPPLRSFNTTLFWSSLGLKCKAISASETARPICQIRRKKCWKWMSAANAVSSVLCSLSFEVEKLIMTSMGTKLTSIGGWLKNLTVEKMLCSQSPTYLFVNWGWIVPRPHASWLDKIMNCLH